MELIEAYADAKVSTNLKLMELAARAVAIWIAQHDIIAPVEVPEEVKKQVEGLTK